MIKKALFVGAMGLVAVLAALGLGPMGRGATPTGALIGQPIQPFAADFMLSGISSTQLGDTNTGGLAMVNLTQGNIIRGQRIAIPWIFADAAYALPLDMDTPVAGTPDGDIIVTLDVLCDSTADSVGDDSLANATPTDPYAWLKATTVVQGTPDSFLYSAVPPYPWLLRNNVVANFFWVSGAQVPTNVTLNTVFTTVPWSPNGGGNTATTKNGGNARAWAASTDGLCIDTPQNSTSHTTSNFAPPQLGDTGGACSGGNCSDAGVYGPTAKNIQTGAGTVAVKSTYVNRGPNAGNFTAHWEIEATNPSVADATLVTSGTKSLDEAEALAVSAVDDDTQNMAVTCPGTGEGLIVVKTVLWPVLPTQDYFPADNANVFTVKVVCGTDASPLVDLSATILKATQVVSPEPSKPEQVNLLNTGQSATVTIRDITSNNAIAAQTASQWLNAETSGVVTATWGSATPLHGGTQSGTGTATTKIAGMSEAPGQSDVTVPLTVTCPAAAPVGRYSVVVKGIVAPAGEAKPQDNAQRLVIMVNCWASMPAGDGKDDGQGIYARWTIAQSNPDARQPYSDGTVGPSFPQDGGPDSKLQNPIGGYVERTLQLGCFWHDSNGCFTNAGGTISCDGSLVGSGHGAADGYFDAAESQQDYDLQQLGGMAAVDPDGDCLAAPAFAQPGHPADLPTIAGTCAPVPWSQAPTQVTYSMAADHDCDGLPDGVEVSWGSNPMVADSDADGANDFVEMFDFTNPLNTDTDADGFLDKPSGVFSDNTDKSMDNCPTVSNADGPGGNSQLNSDGKHRTVGVTITTGKASNPNKDRIGNACDPDNDNDGLPDTVEGVMGTQASGISGTGVPSYDTDGDHCVDGSEVLTGANPTNATIKCPAALTLAQEKFFRACRWNLPKLGAFGGAWDAKNSLNADRAELDPDNDGVNCLIGTSVGDRDNDSGPSALPDVPDAAEVEGYNTNPANKDTDGDGCEDFVQINDVNGSGGVDTTDLLVVAKRSGGVTPANVTSDEIIDVNKDGTINSSDLLQVAKNTCAAKSNAGGCNQTVCKTNVY